MKYTLYLLSGLLVAGTLTLTSCQSDQNSKRIAEESNEEKLDTRAAEKDAQLVVDVTASNYEEIEMAKAAKQKSTNNEIKDIAAMLESDHTMLVNQLKDYAAKHNISVPESATDQAKANARDLAEDNNSAEFDKKWCSELLDKHEKTISKLEDAANTATDPDLKAWINDALPKVRMHRDKLMECKNKLR